MSQTPDELGGPEESEHEPRPHDEFAMPNYSPEQTAQQRDARRTRLLHDGISDLLRLIEFAEQRAAELDVRPQKLADYRNSLQQRLGALSSDLGIHILPRQRPPVQLPSDQAAQRPRSLVFIDECGNHRPHDDLFPYFSVAAVVIAESEYPSIEARWRSWRHHWLAEPDHATHEPKMRPGNLRHVLLPGRLESEALQSMEHIMSDMTFDLIVVVLDHRAFVSKHRGQPVDEFLPRDAYLMCFTFALERVVHLLYHGAGDRVGLVFADQRGRREDALLQREFQRLKVDGTLFLADTWFRYQLGAHIGFKYRREDEVGLQLADLLARPVAEKYANPAATPMRWRIARAKLYDGGPDTRPVYGLKLFPGDHERLAEMLRT